MPSSDSPNKRRNEEDTIVEQRRVKVPRRLVSSADVVALLTSRSHSTRSLATDLLATLPDTATIYSSEAKHVLEIAESVEQDLTGSEHWRKKAVFLRAMKIVKIELRSKHRANRVLEELRSTGSKSPIVMAGSSVPGEVLKHILGFLPREDVLLKVSMMSKAFAAETKNVFTEVSFDSLVFKTWSNAKLIRVLTNCYGDNLLELKVPVGIRLGKQTIQGIAHVCPNLTFLDLKRVFVEQENLLTVAEHFPQLTGIHVSLKEDIPHFKGVIEFVRAMGSRLRKVALCRGWSLRPFLEISHDRGFSQFGEIFHFAPHCPVLKHVRVDNAPIESLRRLCRGSHNLISFKADRVWDFTNFDVFDWDTDFPSLHRDLCDQLSQQLEANRVRLESSGDQS